MVLKPGANKHAGTGEPSDFWRSSRLAGKGGPVMMMHSVAAVVLNGRSSVQRHECDRVAHFNLQMQQAREHASTWEPSYLTSL